MKIANIILMIFISIALVYAKSDKNENKHNSKAPIIIEADNFHFDNKKSVAIYENNVEVRQEDFTLYADKMIIYFFENSNDIKKIEAIDNVRFYKGIYQGSSDKGEYYAQDRFIKLIGNAKLKKGNNIMEGDVITYYLDTEQAFAVGKDRKVRTIIIPEEVKKQ